MSDQVRLPSSACPVPPPSSCPRCGNQQLDARHCKLLCPACGYVESCEDLFQYERSDEQPGADY